MPFAHTARARDGTRDRARGGFESRVVVVVSSSVVRLGSPGTTRIAATARKRSGPFRIATNGDPKRSASGHLKTCLMAIFHCDAAAGRPGEREHFSCLGSTGTTPGQASNHHSPGSRWRAGGNSNPEARAQHPAQSHPHQARVRRARSTGGDRRRPETTGGDRRRPEATGGDQRRSPRENPAFLIQ